MENPLERAEQNYHSQLETIGHYDYYQMLYDHHQSLMYHHQIVQDVFQTVLNSLQSRQVVNDLKLPRVLPGNRHTCPECSTLTGKYPSKLLLEPIVMHRFCKFGSKVGSVSRAKPSPDHTGKQAGG